MKKLSPSKKAFKFSIILNIILLTALLYTPSVNAQIPSGGSYSMNAPNEWTFIKGDTAQGIAVYGIRGVPDPANKPGGGGYSGSWKDNDGNFWIYGAGSEIWKYNIVTNEWTFIKSNGPLNYGTKGVPADANSPGTRRGFLTLADLSGNLWLFGGVYNTFDFPAYYNDTWKFNIGTNQWTWVSGNMGYPVGANYTFAGIYGEKGIPANGNNPGSRAYFASWEDSSKNLWIFGGSQATLLKNDLWKYNSSTSQWTWISGDSILSDFSSLNYGSYGTKGITSVTNKPGSRQNSFSWIDSQGNLWLFGGDGFAFSNKGILNDLWKFNTNTNEWTWVSGDSTINNIGVYGTKGETGPQNIPGSREIGVSWIDSSDNLWLFGGAERKLDTATFGYPVYLSLLKSDLWRYNKNINEWTWVNGDEESGVPGIYNDANPFNNNPGSRYGHKGFKDNNDNFWLFGGLGGGPLQVTPLNDLWKYTPQPNNILPLVEITSPGNGEIFSFNDTISLTANASDADGFINKVAFYYNGIKFAEDTTAPYNFIGTNVPPGTYVLTAKATDNVGATRVSDTIQITINGCNGGGSITGEGYSNIPGNQVSNLTSSPNYPNNPDVTASLNKLEYGPNFGDNYGARVRGYICAPATGSYTFYIAGDDQAGLWLSTDENPANKLLIAYNESSVPFRGYYVYSTQKSAPIYLVKGGRYYIETLHKEAIGPDHLSVAWKTPGGAVEVPIPGSRLSPVGSVFPNTPNFDFKSAMEVAFNKELKVYASPNPSSDYFTVTTRSSSNEKISMIVTDITGRILEKKVNMAANGTVKFGNKLPAGIYIINVKQATKKQIIKVVKL